MGNPLYTLAAVAEGKLSPEGRARATAATLRQIADIMDGEGGTLLTLADLARAYAALSTPQEGDTPPMSARRKTCQDLAILAGDPTGGDLYAVAAAWETVALVLRRKAEAIGGDPRITAMAETMERESRELAG